MGLILPSYSVTCLARHAFFPFVWETCVTNRKNLPVERYRRRNLDERKIITDDVLITDPKD